MNIHVVSNINAGDLFRRQGLGPNGLARRMLIEECARHMDPYVPMSAGAGVHMKNQRYIEPDGVVYMGPYARNMYYGVVMVDPVTKAAGFLTKKGWRSRKGVRKIASNREYDYHGAPRRGKLWDIRMWADKGRVILQGIARMTGGTTE